LRVGLVLLALQGLFLIGLSVDLYRRFTLGIDFGIFDQAWSRIGSGHLDPTSTINGFPYVRSHFELLMWPLALLYPVCHSGMVLLFVQDAALTATGVVVLLWVSALTRRSGATPAWTVAVTAGTVALLLVDPVVYGTAAEDFHFEPLAMGFVVLAAYDLWSGRTTRMWVWAGLCLSCGDIGGLYVVGLGLTGVVAARGNRLRALILLMVGAVWITLVSALGANLGSDVTTGYAYLAGRSVLPDGARGLVLVARGIAGHPGRAWHVAWPRRNEVVAYLRSGGGFGLVTPWGFGVPLVVLSSSALQLTSVYIGVRFQNVVVVPFVTFGTAWLVVWIATRWRIWPMAVVAAVVGVTALVAGGAEAVQQLPAAFTANAADGIVPGARAAALRRALDAVPPGAEAIVSVPIMGRFAQREYVYAALDPALHSSPPLPVHAGTVAVVIDADDDPLGLPPVVAHRLRAELVARGARVVVDSHGILTIVWHPAPGTTDLPLP
jgi:hypothetical protein